jgi:hypothetical protein
MIFTRPQFRGRRSSGSRAARFISGLLTTAAALLLCLPGYAQKRFREGPPPAPKAQPNKGGNGKPNARAMAGLPPKWVEKLQQMPPGERERFLENNERFKSLPPERQQQIRRRLQQYDRLPPEQQNQMTHRAQVFESMTPAQRAHVRNDLLPKWQQLPQDRRQVIKNRLQALSSMPEAQRQQLLNDPKFMQGLSPNEQDLLRNLNALRNP